MEVGYQSQLRHLSRKSSFHPDRSHPGQLHLQSLSQGFSPFVQGGEGRIEHIAEFQPRDPSASDSRFPSSYFPRPFSHVQRVLANLRVMGC